MKDKSNDINLLNALKKKNWYFFMKFQKKTFYEILTTYYCYTPLKGRHIREKQAIIKLMELYLLNKDTKLDKKTKLTVKQASKITRRKITLISF